jgi:hypothetical protein
VDNAAAVLSFTAEVGRNLHGAILRKDFRAVADAVREAASLDRTQC